MMRFNQGCEEEDAFAPTIMLNIDSDIHGSPPQTSVLPTPILGAMVDTAWAVQDVRVSFARLVEGDRFTVLCTVGDQRRPQLAGRQSTMPPRLVAALRTTEDPIAIEDIRVDDKIGAYSELFETTGVAAMLLFGVRSKDGALVGWVSLDASRPRTWGREEIASLERLVPLAGMGLENLELRELLYRSQEELRQLNRENSRRDATLLAISHDLRVVLQACERVPVLGQEVFPYLDSLRTELTELTHPSVASCRSAIDLVAFIHSQQPIWRLVTAFDIVETPVCDPPRVVHAEGASLQRLLLAIVVRLKAFAGPESRLVVTIETETDGPRLCLALELQTPDPNQSRAFWKQDADNRDVSEWLIKEQLLLLGATLDTQVVETGLSVMLHLDALMASTTLD